jgi:DNA-binding response OmpR family regulator
MMSGTPKGDRVADGAGADAFLAKPFLDSELLDSVRALLAAKSAPFPDPRP